MRKRSPVIPILMLSALLVGCTVEPHYINVTGLWTYSASNLSGTDGQGNTVSCTATGSMSLVSSGTADIPDFFGGTLKVSAFTGTYNNLTLVCMVNGAQQTRGPLQGAVSVGEILPYTPSGSFYFDSDRDSVVATWYSFNATVSRDAMKAGDVTTTIDFGAPSGQVLLTGFFTAAKQH